MSKAIKFASAVKEIRIHLCQNGSTSKGVRDFISKYYVDLKYNNPRFPILIRECSKVEPKLWARYEYGKEKSVSLKDLSADDVLSKISAINKIC